MDRQEFEDAMAEAEEAARQLKHELKRAKRLVEDTREKLSQASGRPYDDDQVSA